MTQRDIVVIGASAGGIQALTTLVAGLPRDFPASLLVVETPKRLSLLAGWKLPQFPFGNSLWVVSGTPELMSQWLNYLISGLDNALTLAMIFLVIRLFVRRPRAALESSWSACACSPTRSGR